MKFFIKYFPWLITAYFIASIVSISIIHLILFKEIPELLAFNFWFSSGITAGYFLGVWYLKKYLKFYNEN